MKPLVSISCITYNHEKYIAAALDSFLMQKTDFVFEVLVHDDASSDKTPEIIKKYAAKYPDIIKPIYQEDNQYSKGLKIGPTFNFPRAQGKYIAMCEGDDFWIDPDKLQKQVNYMEKYPECTFCFHNAEVQNVNKQLSNAFMLNRSIESGKYSLGELSLLGFIPTASFLFPKYIFEEFPEWFSKAIVGDLPILLIATSHGYAYYLNEIMSVYRTEVEGSATSKIYKSSDKRVKLIKMNKGIIEILDNVNYYSKYKFSKELNHAKIIREVEVILLEKNKSKLKLEEYRKYFITLKKNERLKFWIRYYIPDIYEKLSKIKLKFKSILKD
jgi:glycosyltransferase involved in cell wall biosynthesis